MRISFWIALARLHERCGPAIQRVSRLVKNIGARGIVLGEKKPSLWSGALFARLFMAEIEIMGAYPKVYRGRIYAARFRMSSQSAKRIVVLHLNWLASRDERFGSFSMTPWEFGGSCDVALDPEVSPLRDADGTLWFMWPDGDYGVIRFDCEKFLPFTGSPDTPRVYKYF